MIICPKCKSVLIKDNNRYVCKNNHSFDIAKEGYCNLLMPNKKNSQLPGDNMLMVQSRELFLNKGYYSKLREKLLELSLKYFSNKISFLDAGCGTGYYSTYIKQKRNTYDKLVCVDISKFALKKAAKKDKESSFFVASTFDLPTKDNSFDLVLNVFSPKAEKEFYRVLKKDGILFEVLPGKEHLIELKRKMYDDVRLNIPEYKYDGFNLLETVNVKNNIKIDNNEDIMNLLAMTPYMYKTKQKDIEKLSKIDMLDITIDFIIAIWKVEK